MMAYDPEELQKRGLIFTGRHLPYNPNLVDRAKDLRKNQTDAERIIWVTLLKKLHFRVLRQHPIDNFIVDFYCPAIKLVIEIDGEQHETHDGLEYDSHRDSVLHSYGLTVLHVKNLDVLERFDNVRRIVLDTVGQSDDMA